MASQNDNTWAAAHLGLIKMKSKAWHKDASGKPDRLTETIMNMASTLSKYSTKMSTTSRSRPLAIRHFCRVNLRVFLVTKVKIILDFCNNAFPTTARSLHGVQILLLYAAIWPASPTTKPCSAMLMLGLPSTNMLPIWRVLLILWRRTPRPTAPKTCERSSALAAPLILSILVPTLRTITNVASVISRIPIPS